MILVMLSGGADSALVLHDLLDAGESVHVHHIHLRSAERRADAEAAAVEAIYGYFRAAGKQFATSESFAGFPVPLRGGLPPDADAVSFAAGTLCAANPQIRRVAIGMTASDGVGTGRLRRADAIFAAFGTGAAKVYPLIEATKAEVLGRLPPALRALTWSCRTPSYGDDGRAVACGICPACRAVAP